MTAPCIPICREMRSQHNKALKGRPHIVLIQSKEFFIPEGHILSCLPGMERFWEVDCGLISLPVLILIEVEENITIFMLISALALPGQQNFGTSLQFTSVNYSQKQGKLFKVKEKHDGRVRNKAHAPGPDTSSVAHHHAVLT